MESLCESRYGALVYEKYPQKIPTAIEDEEKKSGGVGEEAKYGGDSEAAAAARSSARARSATLGDSVACEAEVWLWGYENSTDYMSNTSVAHAGVLWWFCSHDTKQMRN